MISKAAYYSASTALKAMQHKDTRKVLDALRRNREMNQTELWIMLRYNSQPQVAQVLGKMVRCGILVSRREGKNILYKTNGHGMKAIRTSTKHINSIRLENQ